MHETGERTELKNYESTKSLYKNRTMSCETIQKAHFLHEMQEQMNSMNGSGDFQEVESNQSGRLSYVSTQPSMIPSSRSLLSRDRRVPQATGSGTLFARDDKPSRDTIPMPTFARKPSTTSSRIPVEVPQNYMVGQQRQQMWELQFDKFPYPQSFLVWKIRFTNQVTTCSDFPSDAMLWIKEVEMVETLEELKSSRAVC